MPIHDKLKNPFYLLCMAAGMAFAITACAYFVMTLQMLKPERAAEADEGGRAFMKALDDYGVTVMLVELGVLAVATVLAIATDGLWMKLARRREDEDRKGLR